MVAEFNLERRLNTQFYSSSFAEKYSDFLQTVGLKSSPSEWKTREQRIALFGKIIESDKSGSLNKLGFYILIEKLLSRAETCQNPKQSKKLAEIAEKLLGLSENCHIQIAPPEKIESQHYIECIIEKAEDALQGKGDFSSLLKVRAEDLQNNSNELIDFFRKTWGKNIPFRFISFQKFFSSWGEFTKQLMYERINALKSME